MDFPPTDKIEACKRPPTQKSNIDEALGSKQPGLMGSRCPDTPVRKETHPTGLMGSRCPNTLDSPKRSSSDYGQWARRLKRVRRLCPLQIGGIRHSKNGPPKSHNFKKLSRRSGCCGWTAWITQQTMPQQDSENEENEGKKRDEVFSSFSADKEE